MQRMLQDKRLTSMPMTNMKKTRPKLLITCSTVTEEGGKIVSVKWGMRPITVGPRMMPASISATTAGCFICSRRQVWQGLRVGASRVT